MLQNVGSKKNPPFFLTFLGHGIFVHQPFFGPQNKRYPWASPTALPPALPPPRQQLSLAAGAFPLALRAEDTSPQWKIP